MEYKIIGDNLPAVICRLQKGEIIKDAATGRILRRR